MLRFIAEHFYVIPVLGILFMFLYFRGGEDIVFFRRKRYAEESKSQEKLMSPVNRFARSHRFKAYGKTTVEYNGEQQTFDAIILSLYGTIAITANPRGGEIYGDNSKADWVQLFGRDRIEFPNPLNELRGSTRIFRDIYKEENVKHGQTESMVVFTNRIVSVVVPKSLPVCKAENLVSTLEGKKYLADNGADYEAMARALEKHIVK